MSQEEIRSEPLAITAKSSISFILEQGEESIESADGSRSEKTYGNDLNTSDLFLTSENEYRILGDVVEEYGLGEVVGHMPALTYSTTSRKLILQTERGRFFLKEKPDYCVEPDQLRLSAEFQDLLAEQTDFVPKIFRTTKGERYFRRGSKTFLVTKFIEGRHFSGSHCDIQSAGRALGIVHNVSAKIDVGEAVVKHSRVDAARFLDMASNLPNSDDDRWKVKTMEGLSFHLPTQVSNDGLFIINHGDFAPFNAVFDESQMLALNDFDNVGFYLRTRDVADGLLTYCGGINYAGVSSSMRSPISHRIDREKIAIFLAAYFEGAQEFTGEEELNLVDEIINRWIELMALGLVRGDFSYKDVYTSLSFPHEVRSFLRDSL